MEGEREKGEPTEEQEKEAEGLKSVVGSGTQGPYEDITLSSHDETGEKSENQPRSPRSPAHSPRSMSPLKQVEEKEAQQGHSNSDSPGKGGSPAPYPLTSTPTEWVASVAGAVNEADRRRAAEAHRVFQLTLQPIEEQAKERDRLLQIENDRIAAETAKAEADRLEGERLAAEEEDRRREN